MAKSSVPVRHFDSLSALVDYADRDSPNTDRMMASRTTMRNEWTGSESWDDAKRLAFGGWKEGADRVQKRRADIAKMVKGDGYAVAYGRRGPGALSMARYMSGHPRPYAVLVPAAGKPKTVRILINICMSASVTPERIERRGAAVCALVDALEANGRTVEVTVVSNHTYATYYAVIKRAGARLNLPSVAFAVAHPSMLRRVAFGAVEQETGKAWENLRSGYGRVADVEPPEGTIYLGSRTGNGPEFATDASAADWVTRTAAEQGVALR